MSYGDDDDDNDESQLKFLKMKNNSMNDGGLLVSFWLIFLFLYGFTLIIRFSIFEKVFEILMTTFDSSCYRFDNNHHYHHKIKHAQH